MIGIYKITSPSNRVYIGQSRNIKNRFNYYKYSSCKEQPRLYNSFKKYGVENHIFEIIEECVFELLNEKERYWQDFYNVLNGGLNCSLTNSKDKPYVFSEESLKKMKEWKRLSGENHCFYGKKRPEHSIKMSGENSFMWGKKNPKTSEWNRISKIGNKNCLGLKQSEEIKQNLRIKNGGVNHPMYGKKHKPETIEKMKLNSPKANLGKKHSIESRLKMSLKGKGRKQSEEHKRKRALKAIGNPAKSKLVLDFVNGIFYDNAKEVFLIGQANSSYSYFVGKLRGLHENNTNFKYA